MMEDAGGETALFFKAPVFEFLERDLLPRLFAAKRDPVRIWIPRCACGEDAYSIGMLALEAVANGATPPRILATDIDLLALEVARRGLFPLSAVQHLTPARQAFFTRSEERYSQVERPLRDAIIFARQNILADIPFSRLDLIYAPGLLEAFEPAVQRKLVPLLHYALAERGTLVLDHDESLPAADCFFESDRVPGVFTKLPGTKTGFIDWPLVRGNPTPESRAIGFVPSWPRWLQRHVEQSLLEEAAPAAAVLDRNLNVVSFYGPVHLYLHRNAAATFQGVVELARNGLEAAVLNAGCRALNGNRRVRTVGTIVDANGIGQRVAVSARPLGARNLPNRFLLMTFTEDSELQSDVADALRQAEQTIEQLSDRLNAMALALERAVTGPDKG
jgi:two-component system CheB/CheR fusion protein